MVLVMIRTIADASRYKSVLRKKDLNERILKFAWAGVVYKTASIAGEHIHIVTVQEFQILPKVFRL